MMKRATVIRKAKDADLEDVLAVERAAFGHEDEADLVKDLLGDSSAEPIISLLAFDGNKAVGHILFTRAILEPEAPLSIHILPPLAMVPEFQRQGVEGKLIEKGLDILSEMGVDLVFVLGHPEYYPRHGFKPVRDLGFEPTYPIPEKDSDAWMVQELRAGVLARFRGKIICADELNKAEHWRE